MLAASVAPQIRRNRQVLELAAQLQQSADALQAQVDALERPALSLHVQRMRRQEALLLLDGDSTHADRASEEKLPFDLAAA